MICKYVPIPKEETYILIKKAQQGDKEAAEVLLEQNTGLVRKIAGKFASPEHELEDLMQLGYMGLLKAVERFDPSFDVMFSTYAVPMIMGEIKRYFRDHGRIKVSRALKDDIRMLKQVEDAFMEKEGRCPRVAEIAEAMCVSRERVLDVLGARDSLTSITSLDNQVVEKEYRNAAVVDSPEKQIDIMVMKAELAALKEKERLVLVMRYYKDMTQQQIADRIGVSQVQISRIEKQALAKIREKMTEISN